MSRWRILVVIGLLILPFVFLATVGSIYLWSISYGFLTWLVIITCMGTGYILAYRWQNQKVLLKPPQFENPPHWTERDQQALLLVKQKADQAAQFNSELFTQPDTYFQAAKELAQELAQFYFPGAKNPINHLTVPEILAVVELASHDLAMMVDRYLPGGHLMTLKDWQKAKLASDWFQSANNVYWAVSAIFNPIDAAIRLVGSRLGVTTPMLMLQKNLQLWLYVAYLERVGHYLIEVYSGRLKVGTQRYLEMLRQRLPGQSGITPNPSPQDPADAIQKITITLIGQVKAGKSSLVNAILGEQKAITDVLPATSGIDHYELKSPGKETTLIFLDTVGYGHSGPKTDQLNQTREAVLNADIVLMVFHATNPGRQADLEMLQFVRSWFQLKPDLKRPVVLGIVTHIDLLKPVMEWSPPYDWQNPKRTKEKNIHDALEAVYEHFGSYLDGIVPVCTAAEKVYGIDQFLVPALGKLHDLAHGVALLRCIKAESNTGKIRKIFTQLVESGGEAARFFWKKITT